MFVADSASLLGLVAALQKNGDTQAAAEALGRAAGDMLRWAHILVDAGADVADVRRLIDLGLCGAGGSPNG